MRFGWMGWVLVAVLATALELVTVAVAGRCAPLSVAGWSFEDVVGAGGCGLAATRARRP